MIARIVAAASYGVAGVVLVTLAAWGEVVSTSKLSPQGRLVLFFLGLALFVGALRPAKKGG